MALQLDYHDDRLDVTIPDCYWKIPLEDGIQGGKELLNGRILSYKNETVANTNSNEYSGFRFEFVPDLESDINFIAQAYDYVKTLPEFAGATDV